MRFNNKISKHIKKTAFILLLLFSSLLTIGQELDKTFYLLGSLEDYMGRTYPKNNPKQWSYINTLQQDRIGEIKRIEEVTGVKVKKKNKEKGCDNCQELYVLKSFSRAKKINSFYDFNKNRIGRDLLGFAFYTGQLKCDKILNATRAQQISFLAGQFLTAGEKTENAYQLTLYNAPIRYECLIQLLRKLDCKITLEEQVQRIPVGYYITFVPNDEIKKVLDKELLIKKSFADKTEK